MLVVAVVPPGLVSDEAWFAPYAALNSVSPTRCAIGDARPFASLVRQTCRRRPFDEPGTPVGQRPPGSTGAVGGVAQRSAERRTRSSCPRFGPGASRTPRFAALLEDTDGSSERSDRSVGSRLPMRARRRVRRGQKPSAHPPRSPREIRRLQVVSTVVIPARRPRCTMTTKVLLTAVVSAVAPRRRPRRRRRDCSSVGPPTAPAAPSYFGGCGDRAGDHEI